MAIPGNGSPRIVPFPGATDPASQSTLPVLVPPEPNGSSPSALPTLPELAVIGAAQESAAQEPAAQEPTGAPAEKPNGKTSEKAAEKPHERTARERLTSRERQAKPRKHRAGLVVGIVLLALLLAVVGTAVGGFVWLRWYAHDDAADFQGTWYVAGTDAPIEISADAIQLTDTVSYRYRLNTHDKTIEFAIGDMTGYGSYRFSLDRAQLVIFDGRAEADAVLKADIRWLVQALADEATDERNDLTGGVHRNITLLVRDPSTSIDALDATSGRTDANAGASSSDDTGNASADNGASPTDGDAAQPVWSADEWLDSQNPSSSSSTDDVGSLLENISDLPLNGS